MHRPLAPVILSSLQAIVAVALLGASPTPPPLSVRPAVMIFPLQPTSSAIGREADARIETTIANEMAATKAVSVIPAPAGTVPKDELSAARAANADYYVTGFISALGDGASAVEQVVSTRTGIVVFSSSGQLQTYADAAGQGDILASQIAQYANRAYAQLRAPVTPAPAASPAARAAGRSRRGSDGAHPLFWHRARPTPSPAP